MDNSKRGDNRNFTSVKPAEIKELPAATPVFISYAKVDQFSVNPIDQWLRNHNIRVLIDYRDFLPGNYIEDEIVRCIEQSGKVICIYSKNSAHRPYPKLERRIAAALEMQHTEQAESCGRLVYFCIDKTPLPTEALGRLAIKAFEMNFNKACNELLRSILGKSAAPIVLDLSQFENKPPWKMDEIEQQEVSLAAWEAIQHILDGQSSGSTLSKWKRETFEELMENINLLTVDRRFQRILDRLMAIVKKNQQWEERNISYFKGKSKGTSIGTKNVNADNPAAMTAQALSLTMFQGVMADNQTLHRIHSELLADLQWLKEKHFSYEVGIEHMKKVLLS